MTKTDELVGFGAGKGLLVFLGITLLVVLSCFGTAKLVGYLGQQTLTKAIQKKDIEIAKIEKISDLEIRSLESLLKNQEAHLTVLEGEFVFGGTTAGSYSEKELRLQKEYLKRKEAITQARTLPILTAQIEELRPKYKNSQWEKAKVPDLPDSRTMARWFYEAGREVDINPMVLIAVAWVESRFRPDICHGLKQSEAGAIGCMQIMPLHVGRFEFIKDVKELSNDMQLNILTGGYVLREYLDHKYAGQASNQLKAALRLYNYGPKNYGSRIKKKAKFNTYAETVIEKAETLFDGADPLREKFGPENDPAKFLIEPLAMNELRPVDNEGNW